MNTITVQNQLNDLALCKPTFCISYTMKQWKDRQLLEHKLNWNSKVAKMYMQLRTVFIDCTIAMKNVLHIEMNVYWWK